MDVIDGQWIKGRLTGVRGQKADLARALGVQSADISKILSGTRDVQPAEIPKLLAFFGYTIAPVSEIRGEILEGFEKLSPEDQEIVRRTADALNALREREQSRAEASDLDHQAD